MWISPMFFHLYNVQEASFWACHLLKFAGWGRVSWIEFSMKDSILGFMAYKTSFHSRSRSQEYSILPTALVKSYDHTLLAAVYPYPVTQPPFVCLWIFDWIKLTAPSGQVLQVRVPFVTQVTLSLSSATHCPPYINILAATQNDFIANLELQTCATNRHDPKSFLIEAQLI